MLCSGHAVFVEDFPDVQRVSPLYAGSRGADASLFRRISRSVSGVRDLRTIRRRVGLITFIVEFEKVKHADAGWVC
jgi:hypothetical protein